ncbi:thiamine biosynthesis lipoprotein [Keratinibaculum paraultunense]|uniref:FAD:protein FMN transferase n=1 Tax=Keratinibaculum paraultunense TaxID=1278232 RepID=A0A4R3KZN2_9FIRM|nr:FAD:protein FMN transferase [Keratinibaculum paraultunense]QQY80426.1 FAD:protein FMN transferase [Keratinibaculum paraultunense]TCS91142.1 thiamine biosynthesis lipoprotein [Keratinibaculum paraultunense]
MNFKKNSIYAIFILLIILFVVGCTNNQSQPLEKTDFLMDTVINIKIYDNQDKKIMDMAMDRLKEIESRMSVTIANSDISKINESAGIKPVQVHEDVYYVIKKAKYFAELSQGAYEPTIGPLVELWNITDVHGEERKSIPTEEEIEEKMSLIDYNDLVLMEDNQVYLKRKGMKLDLGGIVKGYAADEVKRIFKNNGIQSAIIDLGGNIYALGEKVNGESWRIGIQDPFNIIGNYIGILSVKNQSIVTSGDYERYFLYKGERYHHIIDPKTGYPVKNGLAGVSVVSDKSIDGDALSTALFVLGIEEGTELINQLEDIDEIFITKQKEVYIQEKLKDKFILKDKDFKLIYNPY